MTNEKKYSKGIEKAIRVCHFYLSPFGENPTSLTDEQIRDIQTDLSEKENSIYIKHLNYYHVYDRMLIPVIICHATLSGAANKTIGHLQQWEDYIQEANHLNFLLASTHDTQKDGYSSFLLDSMQMLSFKYAELIPDSEGYVHIDISGKNMLYDVIKDDLQELNKAYTIAKSLITVIDGFSKKYKCEMMIHPKMGYLMDLMREDYYPSKLPQFSKKKLKEKLAKGIEVTEEERYKAVFPSFDEAQPSEEFLDYYKSLLKDATDKYL